MCLLSYYQIIRNIPIEALMLPPVDLDALLNKEPASLTTGGMMSIPRPFLNKRVYFQK